MLGQRNTLVKNSARLTPFAGWFSASPWVLALLLAPALCCKRSWNFCRMPLLYCLDVSMDVSLKSHEENAAREKVLGASLPRRLASRPRR